MTSWTAGMYFNTTDTQFHFIYCMINHIGMSETMKRHIFFLLNNK